MKEGSGNYSADRGWQAVVSSEVVVSVVSSSKSKPKVRAGVEDCEDRSWTIQSWFLGKSRSAMDKTSY